MSDAGSPPSDLSARLAQLSPERRALLEKKMREMAAASSAAPKPDTITHRVSVGQEAPLSYTQELLWMFERAAPHVAVYNSPRYYRVRGALDVAALRYALDTHVARHDVYHTRIVEGAHGPLQRVVPAAHVHLHEIDLREVLRGFDDEARQRLIEGTLRELVRAPFDLEHDQLLRGALIRVAENEHVLLLVSHHIASDDWSRGVMFREIQALYNARVQGRDATLPAVAVQYADYALWQSEHLSGAVLERVLDFWRRELAGAPRVLELPTDRPRTGPLSGEGARMLAVWPAELGERLRALSAANDTTLFMTLLAAWQVLLSRLSGQTDVLIGTPIGGRERPELENLVGYLSDTIVVRARLAGAPTFTEHLANVRARCLAAFENRDAPYEKLQLALASERGETASSIFHSLFTVHTDAGEQFALNGLEITPIVVDAGVSKTDLSLAVRTDADGSMRAMVEYRTELFDAWRIERLHAQFRTLLEGIIANPDERVSKLPLLGEKEMHELAAWNATERPYSSHLTLSQCIERNIDAVPAKTVALELEAATLTFEELESRANQLAHRLVREGVGPGVGVALCFDRSFELVICMLATLKAGGYYVPLDPAYPSDRLAYMLADSGVRVMLTDAAHTSLVPSDDHGTRRLLLDGAWNPSGLLANESDERLASRATTEDLAYVIYTSGSTGQPKGVMIPHRAVVNYLEWMQDVTHVQAGDRVLQKAPASFDASIWEFFLPLVTGATLVLARPGGHQDPEYLLQTITRGRVNVMQLVPSQLQFVLETPGAEALGQLRLLVLGGEALPGELLARLDRTTQVSVLNLYGPTEATVYATMWAHDVRRDGAWDGSPVPIGTPIYNTHVELVDAAMQRVPVGVPGELLIGGVQVARGYHAREALTAEKFVADPFAIGPASTLYRTGDLARRRPDGVIEYLGRIDNQVKVRGFRIELGEIEEALGRHPHVKQCVVVVREDAPGDKRLIAYAVPEGSASSQELREFLLTALPHYMVPSSIELLDAIPMNANGKADRRALPAPTTDRVHVIIAPRTDSERAIAEVWRDVFAVPAISVETGFLDLGGHSLLAIRILSRMRRELGVAIPLDVMLRGGTIAQIATLADELRAAGPASSEADLAIAPVSRDMFRRTRKGA